MGKTRGHGRASKAATCEASNSVTGRSDEDSRSIEDEHEDQPEFGIKLMRIGSCHGEGQEGPRGHGAHELPVPGLQSHDEVRVQKQLDVLKRQVCLRTSDSLYKSVSLDGWHWAKICDESIA